MSVGGNFRNGDVLQGGTLGMITQTLLLSADNQVVNPNIGSLVALNLESDNTTATNRTFTLVNGQTEGQQLVLLLTSGSSTTCDLQDTGNVKLSAAWQPLQYDCLTLFWSSRSSAWIEQCRSDN